MRRSSQVRRTVMLAMVLAGVALLLDRGRDTPPSAHISGTTAMFAPARATAPAPAPTPVPAIAVAVPVLDVPAETTVLALPEHLVGDALLRGQINLDDMQRVDDHYELALAGGRRAILTLDPAVQEAAEKVLKQAKSPYGAVVVMAIDGRVLALAGRQTEEPAKESAYALATTIWAPAASVFKIVTAAALVDAGLTADTKVCFHGGIRSVMESNLTDSKRDNRCETLRYGVAHSQNAIMAKLAQQHLEPATLRASARNFGLDQPLDWALASEAGRVTIPEDKGVPFAKIAAGFWSSELSPIGGALLANTVATGGQRIPPRIVDAVIDGERRIAIEPLAPERVLAPNVAREVASMMEAACDKGSAARAFRAGRGTRGSGQSAAGKTGTLTRDTPYLQYSWFVGFAPSKEPRVSIAVLLGNGALWHLKATSAARMVLDAALDD